MNKSSVLVLLLTSMCWVQLAHADSMRCGNKLVLPGDSMHEVKAKCGEPDDATHRTEVRKIVNRVSAPCPDNSTHANCSSAVVDSVEVAIDEWTYDFGSNRFIQELRFENGKLVSITNGGYGSKAN